MRQKGIGGQTKGVFSPLVVLTNLSGALIKKAFVVLLWRLW